nr:translation initiation factor IF-2-like [Equus asinus]
MQARHALPSSAASSSRCPGFNPEDQGSARGRLSVGSPLTLGRRARPPIPSPRLPPEPPHPPAAPTPRAHLALRGSFLPRPGRPPHARGRRSLRAPGAPSQLRKAGGGFRTGRLGARSTEYEPGTPGKKPLLLDEEAAAALPGAPSTQAGTTPRSEAPRPRPAHSAPLLLRAATLPRPNVRAGALPVFRLAAQWRVGGEEASGGRGRKRTAPLASFVTSRGSDNPFHSARAAHWLHGPASRDRARPPVEGRSGCPGLGNTEAEGQKGQAMAHRQQSPDSVIIWLQLSTQCRALHKYHLERETFKERKKIDELKNVNKSY